MGLRCNGKTTARREILETVLSAFLREWGVVSSLERKIAGEREGCYGGEELKTRKRWRFRESLDRGEL